MDEKQALQFAQQALQLGDKATAQQYLLQAIQANPRSETAWLWLSAIVGDPAKERDCLKRVLSTNPHNELARKHLAELDRTHPLPSQTVPPLFPVTAPPPQPATPPKQSKKKRPIRSCLIVIAALVVLSCILGSLLGLFPGIYSGTDSPSASPSTPKEKIIVEPGTLNNVIEDLGGYPSDKEIVVRKLDGTIDERPNDLEELARDWLFCRQQMVLAATRGDTETRDKYVAEQEQVNRWLDEYHVDDWSTMIALFEDEYSW
jgi:hypothetical protein